jgi:hypothetical protein
MTTLKMRGAVLADVGKPAAMERDAAVPKRRNGVLGDVQARGSCGTDLRSGSPQGVVR